MWQLQQQRQKRSGFGGGPVRRPAPHLSGGEQKELHPLEMNYMIEIKLN
ncbi:hypothetical protein [Curvibacter gracilis]|nr:hypothetical protein [Curvibacter gracilis]